MEIDNIGQVTREEVAIAVYLILTGLRDTARATWPLFPPNDVRAASSRKILADCDSYPETLPGLSFYLLSFIATASISFFCCVLQSSRRHIGLLQHPNVPYISTPAHLIDCLSRPEWWVDRQTVLKSPSQASTMVDLVLGRNSKLECRPWLIKNDNRH